LKIAKTTFDFTWQLQELILWSRTGLLEKPYSGARKVNRPGQIDFT